MTDQLFELTYQGPLARGIAALPERHVPFHRGEAISFTAAECAALGPEWHGARPIVENPDDSGERIGHEVPTGVTSTLIDDEHGGLVVVDGRPLGTIAEVLADAVTAERAAVLLEAEIATKNRPTLVAKLTELAGAGTDPNPADPADTHQEA